MLNTLERPLERENSGANKEQIIPLNCLLSSLPEIPVSAAPLHTLVTRSPTANPSRFRALSRKAPYWKGPEQYQPQGGNVNTTGLEGTWVPKIKEHSERAGEKAGRVRLSQPLPTSQVSPGRVRALCFQDNLLLV